MKRVIITVAIIGTLAVAGGVSARGAFRQKAAESHRISAAVRSHVVQARRLLEVSKGARELARHEGIPSTALKRLTTTSGLNPAAVFGAKKSGAMCAYITRGNGAAGGCMRLANSLVIPRVSIIDGGTYVWGLVDGSVSSVDASTEGRQFSGSISNGLFVIELPDGSHGSGPIELYVTSSGKQTAVHLPGIPTPAIPGG